MDLLERIDSWARHMPGRPAHLSGDRALTYGDLIRGADALAAHLARVLPDDCSPIAIIGHKEPEMLIGFLGAVKAGHPYVPLDTSLPPQRIERIISIARAAVTLTSDSIHSIASGASTSSARTVEDSIARRNSAHPEPVEGRVSTTPISPRRVGETDPYYIIFTSGSTGEPKGVVITLEALTSFVTWTLAEQQFADAEEVFLNQAPFSFDLSVMDLYLSLASGGTLFSITNEQIANPKQLYQAFATSGLTTWVSTPSFAQMCLAERTFAAPMLPRLRRFWFCGETLPPEVAAQLLERFPQAQVWNTYGPTEATCATTSVRVTEEVLRRYSPLPVGYVKPQTRIVIMDEAGRALPDGARGEIVIAGPNVSIGYLARGDLTAQAFFSLDGERAYRTGDWGRFEGELLFFDGRIDSQIKLHGYRIELADVEANLRALPGVRDAVIAPVMKDGRPDSLTAFLILSERPPGSDFQVSRALRTQLAARLPSYMLPRKFLFFDTFPMTANGKVDRRRLAGLLDAGKR